MHPLKELLTFIKDPSYIFINNKKENIVNKIFAFIFFGITLTIFVNSIVFLITPSTSSNIETNLKLENNSDIISFAISAIFFAPVVEEILFRGIVAKSRLYAKRIFLFLIIFYLLFLLSQLSVVSSMIVGLLRLYLPIILLVSSLLFAFIFPIRILYTSTFYSILVYLQAVSFAIMHIGNTRFNNLQSLILIPFLIMNQLYLGFLNAYLASRYGISKAIFSHFLNNFISVLIVIASTIKENELVRLFCLLLSLTAFGYSFYCFFDITSKSYKNSNKLKLDK
jgi:hypothetical protein